jgi:N-acetylneuraminic acid mutarotase
VNGRIYIIGGADADSVFKGTVEAFTPPALQPEDSWATKANMPTARWSATANEVNGKIYVIGGLSTLGTSAIVEEYDPAINTWTNCGAGCSSMVQPRNGHTASEVNGKIYVFGDDTSLSTVEEYDPNSNAWSSRNPAWSARSLPTSSVVNGKIYVIGGWTSGASNMVEEFDPATNTWTNCGGNCSSMPTARSGPTSAVVNGKIYAVGGGTGGQSLLTAVEEYDPATNTWTNCGGGCASIPTPREAPTTSVINGKIHVVGGNNAVNLFYDIIEVFDPVSNAWSSMTAMPTQRSAPASAASNGKLYVIGGVQLGDVALNTVEAYTPPGL